MQELNNIIHFLCENFEKSLEALSQNISRNFKDVNVITKITYFQLN